MIITDIRLAQLKVPLVTPFKTALRTVNNIDDLVVQIETNTGHIGYGSAPATPSITGDTHESMIQVINHVFKPALHGENIHNLRHLITIIQGGVAKHVSAKAALEIAIYDLFGQLNHQPLYQLLGGDTKQLKTDVTISINDIDKMIADANVAISQGFDVLKVKVGTEIEQDMMRIEQLYKKVSHQATMRLDVNQAWLPEQTVQALNLLHSKGVSLELVEQPVNASNLNGMRYITQNVNTPIMADESAFNVKQVSEIIETHSADIINIKLMKSAGISQALRITELCEHHRVDCMIGCMLESSIGVAAAAHFASAKAEVISKIDLDSPALGLFDPVNGGVYFDHANIYLNDKPGLGITRVEGLIYL